MCRIFMVEQGVFLIQFLGHEDGVELVELRGRLFLVERVRQFGVALKTAEGFGRVCPRQCLGEPFLRILFLKREIRLLRQADGLSKFCCGKFFLSLTEENISKLVVTDGLRVEVAVPFQYGQSLFNGILGLTYFVHFDEHAGHLRLPYGHLLVSVSFLIELVGHFRIFERLGQSVKIKVYL